MNSTSDFIVSNGRPSRTIRRAWRTISPVALEPPLESITANFRPGYSPESSWATMRAREQQPDILLEKAI